MSIRDVEQRVAWQLAEAYKTEVYALLDGSAKASRDFAFRDQMRACTVSVGMNIGEGFYRFGARDFSRFLSIALASLGESRLWLREGISRRYFQTPACADAFALNHRCRVATLKLHHSLTPFTKPAPKTKSRLSPPGSPSPQIHPKEPPESDDC